MDLIHPLLMELFDGRVTELVDDFLYEVKPHGVLISGLAIPPICDPVIWSFVDPPVLGVSSEE